MVVVVGWPMGDGDDQPSLFLPPFNPSGEGAGGGGERWWWWWWWCLHTGSPMTYSIERERESTLHQNRKEEEEEEG